MIPDHITLAIAAVDLTSGAADSFKLAEKDTGVYEGKDLQRNCRRYDVDSAGNFFHLFTSHDGVHVYKYELEMAGE